MGDKSGTRGAKRLLNGSFLDTLVVYSESEHRITYSIDDAPSPILCRVVEVEHARRVLTLADECRVAVTQQVHRRLGDGHADYHANLASYPAWHNYFREHQPPTLVLWGKNDSLLGVEGAHAYRRDLKDVEVHLLDTGHFALEEDAAVIAAHITQFIKSRVPGASCARAG
ncbi:MAG: alpha/beta hydrolase [Gammaproteobacteria bacterium]|nr:alpha/beta hydrolase [Gammaproteobacteria bacterium]